MATSRGKAEVKRFIAQLPGAFEKNILRGAARAAAVIVADDAKERTQSEAVRAAIKVSTRVGDGTVAAKVQAKGPGAYLAPWEEYGTAAHVISVDPEETGGRSARRVNDQVKRGELVINGNFVGKSVRHPGARPHPFLRPALDTKEAEALQAAQAYIDRRVAARDLTSPPPEDDQ